MKKEKFYKSIRKENDIKIMDTVLRLKAGDSKYDDNSIIDLWNINKEDLEYAVLKILEYNNIQRIVIDASSKDAVDFIKAEQTSVFMKEGGFQKEYNEYLEVTDIDKIIKTNQAKILQRDVKYYYLPYIISITSLLISLYILFSK